MRTYYTETYRPLLQGVVDKCEDQFEQKLVYIAAGALGLSFAFVTDIVDINSSHCRWVLVLGWILLVACICVNFLSHIWSKNYARKTIDEIDEESQKDTFDAQNISDRINVRNRRIHRVNILTTWLMVLGMMSILGYASINIFMSK